MALSAERQAELEAIFAEPSVSPVEMSAERQAELEAIFAEPTQLPAQQPTQQVLRPGETLDMDIGPTTAGGLFAEDVGQFAQDVGKAAQSRETFQAVGGTVGAALGLPAGPAGAAALGVLGVAGGDALFNIIESAKAVFAGQEAAPLTIEGVKKAFEKPLAAATTEAGFTTALGAAGIPLRAAKPFIGRALKVTTEQARELMRNAKQLDIPLGAINVTPREAIKGFSRVLGVFPFVGTPLRESFASQTAAIDRSLDKILNEVAPSASVSEIGIDLTKFATKKFKAFRRLSGSLYDDFLKKAEDASVPDIFPTTNLNQAANNIIETQKTGLIPTQQAVEAAELATAKQKSVREFLAPPSITQAPIPEVTPPLRPLAGESDILVNFINKATQLPERLTALQIRSLQRSLQAIMSKAAADGFDVSRGIQLKKALELDFNNPQIDLLNPQEGQELIGSLTRANKFFAENIKRFETATAKKFGRIDKNIFKPKFTQAGARETDEAFSAVFNAKSPEALNNLRDVVGSKVFKRAARKHLDNSVSKAITETVGEGGEAIRIFDPVRLEKQLGLNTPDGRKMLETILQGTGVTLKQLDDFNRVVQAVGSVEIPDVSKFLQRRITLGGAAAITGLGGFAAGGGGILTKLGLLALTRSTARLLSSPQALKDMQAIISPTVTTQVKRATILRLLRSFPEGEEKTALTEAVNELEN